MVIDNKTKELMIYLLYHLDSFINEEAYQVLHDSTEDPHHSAVTLYNLIKCLIDANQVFGIQSEYHNVEEFLRAQCFTEEEIQMIERKRLQESQYYIGKQY